MLIDIITLFPDLIGSTLNYSIVKSAISKKLITINLHNLRDYSEDKHKRVDDYQYGGGSGMVIRVEPVANCIEALTSKNNYDEVVFTCPEGEIFNQNSANQLSLKKKIILFSGHYKGIDERIRKLFVTKEISIGNYVLTGGELPIAIIVDALTRLIPGVLGNEESALTDSFQDDLIAPPLYTRPKSYKNLEVPEVLLSGDEKKIAQWRLEQSIKKTEKLRPDLLNRF